MKWFVSAFFLTVFLISCGPDQRNSKETSMKLRPVDSISPVTQQWITDLEKRVGGKLPEDYVAFLKVSNGGWIPRNRPPKSIDGPILQGFLPVMTGSNNFGAIDSLLMYNILADGRLPPWFVPIAATGRAAVYCLSVAAKDKGSVYIVYEDDDQDNVPFEKRDYEHCATSFSDFYRKVEENYAE